MSNPTGKRRLKIQNCKSASSVSMAKENVKSAVSAQGPVVQSHDSTKPSPLVQALHDLGRVIKCNDGMSRI